MSVLGALTDSSGSEYDFGASIELIMIQSGHPSDAIEVRGACPNEECNLQ